MCNTSIFLFLAAILHGQGSGLELGLRLTVTGPNGCRDIRSVQRPALLVEAGQSATPFVEVGMFKARWEGFLYLESRSRLYFSFGGSGRVRLTIGDKEVLSAIGEDLSETETERLRLNSGYLPLLLEYEAPEKGDAVIRLYWRGRDFAREPIPPSAFRRAAGPAEGDTLRQGRTLFAESSCIRCHEDVALVGPGSMPELGQRAPLFAGIGSRLNADWMAQWVANPVHLRSSAKMPSLLGLKGAEDALVKKDTRPWDVAAWLATLQGEAPKSLIKDGLVVAKQGRELFHTLGCIGCHKAGPEPGGTKDFDRIDLTNIDGKFKNGALRDFLLKPWAHYSWVRMPDFGLSQEEATQLAVFLRSLKKGGPTKGFPGNVKKGEMLVLSLGCLNCHKNPIKEFYQAPSMSSIVKAGDKGCLAEFPKTAPNFHFTTEQRAALKIFLGKGTQSLKRRSLAEFAERQVIALNCRACHPMDGAQNRLSHLPGLTPHLSVEVGDADAEAAGRKKDPPDLTHVGEMLQTDWMARLFTGKLNYKPRPWMKMRMPAFPARGEHFAHGLAQKHGIPSGVKQPTFEASQTSVGQKLVSTNGGFGCVACHAVGDKPALAPFEGQGLNFTYSRERLNHEFYMRWMLNPQRLNSFSIMPRYADDEGQTALADVLAGDARDQFNAIWQYLANGDL